MTTVLVVLLLALGCDNPLASDEPELNCNPRIPFWPDADHDGIGDDGAVVYIGCEAPDGYVDVPPGGDVSQPVEAADTAAIGS